MEYELYLLLNVLGVIVVVLIIGYHFLCLDEDDKAEKIQVKQVGKAKEK